MDIIAGVRLQFIDSTRADSQLHEQKHTFKFKNVISKLNGQTVTLRMERQVDNTARFAPYREEDYNLHY